MGNKRVGILALQGDFDSHQKKLLSLGISSFLIKSHSELAAIDALIIPGGESTTFLKLLNQELREEIVKRANDGMPMLATCAGSILLAREVLNPNQDSLGIVDIEITRNAYGRQVDSFIVPTLNWKDNSQEPFEGVFIRAPKITQLGESVEILIEHSGDPVLVKQGNILAATFHPELSDDGICIHQLLLDLCN